MKTKSNVQPLSQAAIDVCLRTNRVGVLSLTDGTTPYGIPLAYFYEDGTIYLTIARAGRKMDYIRQNKKVSFLVYDIPEGFGAPGKTYWTSVICEGELENITAPEELTRAVRAGERHMGMPAGTWDRILQMTLANPQSSNFWKIRVLQYGGRGVDDEKIEFESE